LIFVFDISRPSTFQHLNRDLEIVAKKVPGRPLLVIGNKKDLMLEEEIKLILEKHSISYDYLTSAKTGDTVEEAFNDLATLLNDEA